MGNHLSSAPGVFPHRESRFVHVSGCAPLSRGQSLHLNISAEHAVRTGWANGVGLSGAIGRRVACCCLLLCLAPAWTQAHAEQRVAWLWDGAEAPAWSSRHVAIVVQPRVAARRPGARAAPRHQPGPGERGPGHAGGACAALRHPSAARSRHRPRRDRPGDAAGCRPGANQAGCNWTWKPILRSGPRTWRWCATYAPRCRLRSSSA